MSALVSVPGSKDLKAVLAKHPRLTCFGFQPTKTMSDDKFIADRKAMTSKSAVEEFQTAVAWLREIRRTKTPNHGSYYLKHCAENWGRAHEKCAYIANGMFIAAAIYEGIAMTTPTESSQNVMFGLRASDVKRHADKYGCI